MSGTKMGSIDLNEQESASTEAMQSHAVEPHPGNKTPTVPGPGQANSTVPSSTRGNGVSRETQRQIAVISEVFGGNWRQDYKGRSVSALYREAIDDDRAVVYARVLPEVKDMLWQLVESWESNISDTIELLIEEEHAEYFNED